MQTTKRNPSLHQRGDKKTPSTPVRRQDVRSAPLELDARTLRHVSGGVSEAEGPKKYW